jgi:hypothetical protein
MLRIRISRGLHEAELGRGRRRYPCEDREANAGGATRGDPTSNHLVFSKENLRDDDKIIRICEIYSFAAAGRPSLRRLDRPKNQDQPVNGAELNTSIGSPRNTSKPVCLAVRVLGIQIIDDEVFVGWHT